MPPKLKTVANVVKHTIDLHDSISINNLEKTESDEKKYFETDDLLHNNKKHTFKKCNYLKNNRFKPYTSLEELYIERSEISSIRDLMLYGKSQTISRLLYYFWMDMDQPKSHLQSLHSTFLKHWLKGKIEMVKRDIPFIFEKEHLEKNIQHMTPSFRDDFSIDYLHYNMFGDNELIDRYGRFSAGSLIKINIEIAKMDNIINQRESLYTKIFAFIFSSTYLFGKLIFPIVFDDYKNYTSYL